MAHTSIGRVALVGFLLVGGSLGYAQAQQPGNPFALQGTGSCDQLLGRFKADAKAGLAAYLTPPPTVVAAAGNAPVTSAAPAVAAAPATPVSGDGQTKRKATAGSGGGSSGTNTQESGVDEGDLVENDGRYVYAVNGAELRIVDTKSRRLVTSLGIGDALGDAPQLILAGKRLVVVSLVSDAQGRSTPPGTPPGLLLVAYPPQSTRITVLDISRPEAPVVVRKTTVEGSVTSVRATGNIVRLVMNSPSSWQFNDQVAHTTQTSDAAQAGIDATTIKDWLPRVESRVAGRQVATRVAIACARIWRADAASQQANPYAGNSLFTSLTWLASLDMSATGELIGSAGLIGATTGFGGPQVAYSSEASYFVTAPVFGSSGPTTAIHQFRFGRSTIADYVGSGSVPGMPLNSYALDEAGDTLRVATTEQLATSVSGIRILRTGRQPLQEIGNVGDLGRGEQIRAVRYMDNTAYVVTFRRTDPLYVVDLRDPANPRVTGELKINGYSAYLHPVGPGRLLGVGQDATDQGRVSGLQVSLFDVSDPTQPLRIDAVAIGGNSEAEQDYHAFLYWPKTGDAAIPTFADSGTSGLTMVRVKGSSLQQRPAVVHAAPSSLEGYPQIRRAMIVGGRLITVSGSGVQINDLQTLARLGYVSFQV